MSTGYGKEPVCKNCGYPITLVSTEPQLTIEISRVPDGWYLESLQDVRTPHKFAGHVATHIEWRCQLQHVNGGRLTSVTDVTPQAAIDRAINLIKEQTNGRLSNHH